MSQYILANTINFFGNILSRGKVIDSNVYDVATLQSAGAKLVALNASTQARSDDLLRQKLKGHDVPLDFGQNEDAVSPFSVVPSGGDLAVYTAAPGLVALDLVYLSAADTVAKASAADASKIAIGFVRAMLDATNAEVQGEAELGGFVGLTPGATYFMAVAAGAITATAPSTAGQVVQKVGVAIDATTLLIDVDRDFVLL